jgi:hypothetical protein
MAANAITANARTSANAGEADDQHHPAAPAAERGEPAQADRVRPHDQQGDGDGREHRGRAGEQVDLAGRGKPLLPEQDQAGGGRADQRGVGHPAPRRDDPAAGGRAGSGVARAAGAVPPHGQRRRAGQRGGDDQARQPPGQ